MLAQELFTLKKQILQLSAMVEERVRTASEITLSLNADDVSALIASDQEVDDMEILIEEHCLKILALHQPMASDLRFIITVIKITNEMERIADMAVGIARRIRNINGDNNNQRVPFNFTPMFERVLIMLRKSFDALINRDSELAKTVFQDDEVVDTIRNDCYKKMNTLLMEDNSQPYYYMDTYLLSRHLERIADRAVNIAEEVVYMVEGKITRFP